MLIGICGFRGSGKDTVADLIGNSPSFENYEIVKRAFAYPLKTFVSGLFQLSEEQVNGSLKEVPDERWYGCTPRTAMQYVGTDFIREKLNTIMPGIGEDYFVKYHENWRNVTLKQHPNTLILIPDLRFLNEYEYIKENGGIIIRVHREAVTPKKEDVVHKSESEHLLFTDCLEIDNNDSIQKLQDVLNKIFQS